MKTPERQQPETLELRARPRPVKRLNRRAIAVMLGGLIIGVMLVLLWGLRKPTTKNAQEAAATRQTVEHVAKPEGLNLLPKDYASLPRPPVPQLGAPVGELGRPLVRAEREAGLPELPERPTYRQNPEEDAIRAQRLKEAREGEEAAKAQTRLTLSHTTKPTTVELPQPPLVTPNPLDPAKSTKQTPSDPNKQADKQDFLDQEPDARIYASSTLQMSRSVFQLISGTIIPAALVTGIRSDLPGQAIAAVTENVFDTVTGRFLLIPQGSRLIGEYDSDVAYGQRRVLLVWTRLIMPDGSSVVLDRLPATDAEGYAGLEDQVDWHWRRIFGGATVSTLLGVGAELASPEQRGRDDAVVIATRESMQETVNQIGQEVTRRNLDIQPTLTERPGLPLRLIVNKDLVLRPYTPAGGL